jgi:predicted small integral membrane protein
MAWTVPTALFFAAVAVALLIMSVWEIRSPAVPRRGFLPMVTTRGDRFFITLLTSAYLHAAWLALSDGSVLVASAISLLVGFVLMRWG